MGLKREGLIHNKLSAEGEALHSLVQSGKGYLTCVHCGESTLIAAEDQVGFPPHPPTEISRDFHVLFHTWESFGICGQCQIRI